METKDTSNIKIVPPAKEDNLGIEQVFYNTWLDTYPNKEYGITTEDVEFMFKERFTEEALEKRWEKIETSTNRRMLVAKDSDDSDRVVGLIVITLHEDKNQLQAIYILPEYQGQGIGGRLWNEAQKFLDHKKKTIVQCAVYNTKAIAFYQKFGFKDNGKRWNDEKLRMQSGAVIPEMEMEINIK